MSNRPYFKFLTGQLQEIFNENKKNLDVLKKLLDELQHREKPKAIALRSKVEEAIKLVNTSGVKTVNTNSSSKSQAPGTQQPLLKPHISAQVPKLQQPSLFTQSESDSKPVNVQQREQVKEKTAATASSTLRDVYVDKDETTSAHNEEQSIKAQKGVIRARGKLSDVPNKWVSKQKDDIKLNLPKEASIIKRYEASLKALIADMKKNPASSRQIYLENGQSVKIGRDFGYQFHYEDDAELFEGAAVVVIIKGTHSDGHIVTVSGNQIVISLSEDFGTHIASCIIKVDNTAMLEALRSRLEKISGGEFPEFNTRLAESVMHNEGNELPPSPSSLSTMSNLNNAQREAILRTLTNEVFYIWGPPGTGKTLTLGILCQELYERNKRILLCSNTNQAVDQVLWKLCNEFNKTLKGKQILDEGRIVRIGRIVHAQLIEQWSNYITLDGIVERKSVLLRERKAVLEEQLDRINKSFAHAREILKQFEFLDGLVTHEKKLRSEYEKALKAHTDILKEEHVKLEELQKIENNIKRYELAGTIKKAFMTKPEVLEKNKISIQTEINTLKGKAAVSMQAIQEWKPQLDNITTTITKTQNVLAGFNRKDVEKKVEEADKQRQPILNEITEINKQLDELMKVVVDNAKIVGATVTKAYLSPQMFSSFDVVIIDEASMVLLPALYHAAGLAKEKVVISGDFRQLAPIVTTEQKAILEVIGKDIFQAAGLNSTKIEIKRRVMLNEQYRMKEPICKLISKIMYDDKLKTGTRESNDLPPLKPFDATLTIVDTSPIYPFVNRDPFNSRFNLMNALAIRNLCLHLKENGYLKDLSCVGVCTPYAAQAKVIKHIFDESNLTDLVESGTVHRYQGNEKAVMVLDIPDSVGESYVGMFLQAESPDDKGAMLFNVAVSRAQSHLIVFANLNYLDKKLPAYSVLRDILFRMQCDGSIIDMRDVLAFYPVMNDLKKYGTPFDLSSETQTTGLFNQADFDIVCRADMERAHRGIAIFSGFVTPQRVGSYESLFRSKRADGIVIRCITRPPDKNGNIPFEQGKEALDGLERMDCIVDTRGEIHEKVVIIDDEIIWFGSLNPLSHTNKTTELMARIEGKQVAKQLSAFLALNKSVKPDSLNSEGVIYNAENPRCPKCGSRTSYKKGRFGYYWDCELEGCVWTESYDKPKSSYNSLGSGGQSNINNANCPECGAPMVVRMGKFGSFIACSAYPKCKYIERKKQTSGRTRKKKHQ